MNMLIVCPNIIPFVNQANLQLNDKNVNYFFIKFTFGQKGRSKGGVLHVAGDWSDHELLFGGPPRVGGRAARLEPILALAVLV